MAEARKTDNLEMIRVGRSYDSYQVVCKLMMKKHHLKIQVKFVSHYLHCKFTDSN